MNRILSSLIQLVASTSESYTLCRIGISSLCGYSVMAYITTKDTGNIGAGLLAGGCGAMAAAVPGACPFGLIIAPILFIIPMLGLRHHSQ